MDKKLLDKRIEEFCEEKHVTCQVRVTIKDKIVYEKTVGYADNEKKIGIMKAITDSCGMSTKANGIVISLPIDNIMGINS